MPHSQASASIGRASVRQDMSVRDDEDGVKLAVMSGEGVLLWNHQKKRHAQLPLSTEVLQLHLSMLRIQLERERLAFAQSVLLPSAAA